LWQSGEGLAEWLLRYLPIFLGALGSAPFFYQVYRDRRTRQRLEGLARTALDGWGKAMNLLNRYLIIESDVDERIKSEYTKLEGEYQAAWNEYEGRNEVKK